MPPSCTSVSSVPPKTAHRCRSDCPNCPLNPLTPIRRWILAGAPDWTATTTPLRRFITPREVLTTIETHLNSLSAFDRSFARYFTMTHLYNAAETPEILAEYRKALYKLINSLSWGSGITNPQPIDPQATIFYIDLRHYEWDRNDGWTKIEEAYPYHISFDAPAQNALREQLGRLQTQTKTDVPSVHIDWFIANRIHSAVIPRPAFAAVDRQRFRDPPGGRCRRQSGECTRSARLASGIQQFRRLQSQPRRGTPYLSAWGVLEELRLCRQCRVHKTSLPTRSVSHTMVGKPSSICQTGCRGTTLPMLPVSGWMRRR